MHTCVSARAILQGTVSAASGEADSSHKADNLLSNSGSWTTRKTDSPQNDFVIIDYKEPCSVSSIVITAVQPDLLPQDFRLEGSIDGKIWKILHTEKNFVSDETAIQLQIPLTSLRYLKLFISRAALKAGKYGCELSRLEAGIAGIRETTVSSSSSSEKGASALFDNKSDTLWESALKTSAGKETADFDLGQLFLLNRIDIRSTALEGFPENFSLQASSDGKVWIHMADEKKFKAEKNHTYSWTLDGVNARYLRFECTAVKTGDNSFCVRIGGFSIFAAQIDDAHCHSSAGNPSHASVFQGGIVRLAKDGEDTKGAAVQASDRRLRDGSTLFKGIVQFADNGAALKGLAVQASDDRLKLAEETRPGIVKLAYDGERKAGSVVQGNDSRLKEATDKSNGIVRLCPDGAFSDTGVVRGSDSRLKNATVSSAGIIRLADDGENNPLCAVQGNDRRLKDASTSAKGIVELAEDGESKQGLAVQSNDKRLKDASTSAKGIVELAEDGENTALTAVQGNDSRLKDATIEAKGIVRLADDGEDAPKAAVQGNDCRLKNASTSAKGIVELAEDGEDRPDVAVQGNDRRLKNATEKQKGIMRFASDGEAVALAAVQGSDKRLKDATTISKGIIELAEDGEDRPNVAVQGNDRRLKDAGTAAKGIVELAEDGEDRPDVAVQGNDRRLKDASTAAKGIVELAEDGEDRPNVAVQGNDRRLKDATEHTKGIFRFASDGEAAALAAVQGNDKRLKDASTISKGIVELAEDGEDNKGVAVQGNDRRLKDATEETAGIVRFAKNGENRKLSAVQSDDQRLGDARRPLPHNHDYAPLTHDFNSHTGLISIQEDRAQEFRGLTPPPSKGSVIFAENRSEQKGAAGITAVVNPSGKKNEHAYGVVGHSPFVGVRGQSAGNGGSVRGAGMIGISRFGAGGLFSSEHDYSLVVDGFGKITGYDDSLELSGEGKAMLVHGDSVIRGSIAFESFGKKKSDHPRSICEYFLVDNQDYISPGDILSVSEAGEGVLTRSQTKYQKSVIGIVAGNPTVSLNNSGEQEKIYPVVLCGKALCRVDARKTPIRPGDLIVTSDTPGCGMQGKIDSFDKIGTVIGKALESLNDGIGTIEVFIMHQ
jgi:hypothetical protein